jgi:energy-coupling factor transporter ATP-binding protein EcfA2
MITIHDYSFKYNISDTWVLKDISLSIDRELVLITGKSGSGKSTLAKSIAGFLKETGESTGEIYIDGSRISECDLFELSQKVGIVQQDPESQICTMNVTDEVAFGLENLCYPQSKIEERITWALSIAGGEYIKNRDTTSLSGGEKQKVAIASILAMKPEVIIFDEPTSNLDVKTTKEIMEVIKKIQKKADVSAIVIEHKWEHIQKYADSIYQMNDGHLKKIENLPKAPYTGYKTDTGNPVLKIKDVSFSYEDTLLDGIDLTVSENEIIGIMGDNGSGKTTLLLCIMNFLNYTGDILLNGSSIKGEKTFDIARDIGLIFQNPNHQIFENTVYKEAAFASNNFGVHGPVGELLQKSGLENYINKNPFRLSYGEKRRLNIVSVLSYNPQVLLLDEPFIGQDYENVQKIMDLLKQTTCIIVLHDPFIAKAFCNRIFELKEGKLHEIESFH